MCSVASPGVVVLADGARVADAIAAVGGAASDADTEQLNLARVLGDGEQVRVPHVGEQLAAPDPAPSLPGASGGGAAAGASGGRPPAAGPIKGRLLQQIVQQHRRLRCGGLRLGEFQGHQTRRPGERVLRSR